MAGSQPGELTSGGGGDIPSSSVTNVFKAVVVVLLVVSAATVLITPDTSDDVVGVLHLYEVLAAHVFIGWLKAPEIVTVHSFGRETSAYSSSSGLQNLVCVWLC
jgi:hypothetical protein